jgi:hypothetical protein
VLAITSDAPKVTFPNVPSPCRIVPVAPCTRSR